MQCTGKCSTAAITQINNTNGIIVMRYFTEFTPSSKITAPVPNSLQFNAHTLFLAVLRPNHSSSPKLFPVPCRHTRLLAVLKITVPIPNSFQFHVDTHVSLQSSNKITVPIHSLQFHAYTHVSLQSSNKITVPIQTLYSSMHTHTFLCSPPPLQIPYMYIPFYF